MNSQEELSKKEENNLPVFISINTRELVSPEQLQVEEIDFCDVKRNRQKKRSVSDKLEEIPRCKSSAYPLDLVWHPKDLNFKLDEKAVRKKITVCNPCARSIYVHCCGFSNGTVRLVSRWKYFPKTRFFLSPGMNVQFTIQVVPKDDPIIPVANMTLEIAAAHMRSNFIGLFQLPIKVKFLNYVFTEGEQVE